MEKKKKKGVKEAEGISTVYNCIFILIKCFHHVYIVNMNNDPKILSLKKEMFPQIYPKN